VPGPIEVFISYAPQDAELRRELEVHLAIMRRQGLIRAWHAEQIGPGQSWRTLIDSHVSSAQLILLLISPSFFDSDDCHDLEMAKALERWQRGEAQVVPILLRSCTWEKTQLRRLLPLPDNRSAVISWARRDDAWENVVRGLWRLVDRMAQGQGVPAPPPAPTVPGRQSPAGPWSPYASAPSYPSYPSAPQSSPRASAPSYPSAPQPSPRPSAPSDPAMAPWPQRSSAPSYPYAARPSAMPALSSPRPSLPQPEPQPAKKSAFTMGVLMLFAMAGAGIAAFMLATQTLPDEEYSEPSPAATTAPPVTSPRATSSHLPASAPALADPGTCSSPCCGGSLCAVDAQNITKPVCKAGDDQCLPCPSRRQCVPGSCSSLLDPAQPFMLRLAHANLRGQAPPLSVQVCVRPSGSSAAYKCTPYGQSSDLPNATEASSVTGRLPITVADVMTGRGIEISLWDGQTLIARNDRAEHRDIGITALCKGLKFPLKDPANTQVSLGYVVFYLDDP